MEKWLGCGYSDWMTTKGARSRHLDSLRGILAARILRSGFLVSGLLVTGLLAPALSGCSPAGTSPDPQGTRGVSEAAVHAADKSWAAELSVAKKLLYVTTYGSSSCPAWVNSLTLTDGNHLEITTQMKNGGGVCTADMAPWTSSIAVPESVFSNSIIRVSLAGHTEDISLTLAK